MLASNQAPQGAAKAMRKSETAPPKNEEEETAHERHETVSKSPARRIRSEGGKEGPTSAREGIHTQQAIASSFL